MTGVTKIEYNGSKWIGEAPDSIEVLFSRLSSLRLDPDRHWSVTHPKNDSLRRYVGNFIALSAGFSVVVKKNSPADTALRNAFRRNRSIKADQH